MDAVHVRVGSLVITSRIKVFHSPKELRVRREHVFEWSMPVAGFAEKNLTRLFQNLSFDNYGFIGERTFRQIVMKNAVADFEHVFRTNGFGPSGTERRRCSFAFALKGDVRPSGYREAAPWKGLVNSTRDVPRSVGEL
jgi:hypothetical protein